MSEELDLSSALDGARLASSLPYIKADYARQEAALINRMDGLLRDGKLSPEVAQIGWLELLTARRNIRRLEQRVQSGISAGKRQSGTLNGLPEPPLPV